METEIRKRKKKKGGRRDIAKGERERNRGGDPGGHAGDEGEELVMVMRRCNDSSAVRSKLALSLSFSLSLSLFPSLFPPLFLSVHPFCFARFFTFVLPSYGDDPRTAYAPFYVLLFTGTWLLSARLAISSVQLCMWSARALIRRIMGRLLTLNTVNNSRSGAALSVTRNRRCSNEYLFHCYDRDRHEGNFNLRALIFFYTKYILRFFSVN